jgi:hypothetical protein
MHKPERGKRACNICENPLSDVLDGCQDGIRGYRRMKNHGTIN